MDSLVCMGASITMAHGFNKVAEPNDRAVAVIGDSTFVHSGLTGMANLVYNKGVTAVIVLDNGVTAMTGHQPNPASSWRLGGKPGDMEPTLNIEAVCRAMGVSDVVVVDACDLKAMDAALEGRKSNTRPAVIIVRGPCSMVDRRKRGSYRVTEDCVRCKTCFKLGCPALSIEDEAVVILDFLCTGCGICAQVCPKKAIREVGGESDGKARG
jgi:indolepyruvate ferredoxin oxidoreductase alpha subunit